MVATHVFESKNENLALLRNVVTIYLLLQLFYMFNFVNNYIEIRRKRVVK